MGLNQYSPSSVAVTQRKLVGLADFLYIMRQVRCVLQNWSSHAVRTPILQSTRRQFADEETVDEENCRRGGQCRLFGIDRRGDSSTRKQLTRSNVDEESTLPDALVFVIGDRGAHHCHDQSLNNQSIQSTL